MQALRYWDYYGMTETIADLYDRSLKQQSFSHLYDVITSQENILLAYRTIKRIQAAPFGPPCQRLD